MNQEKISKKTSELNKENRKYLPRAALIFIICSVAGFFCGRFFRWVQEGSSVSSFFSDFSDRSGYLILVLTAVVDIIGLTFYLPAMIRNHKSILAWDGDDEDMAARIERNLLKMLNASNVFLIILLFLFGAGICLNYQHEEIVKPLITSLCFIGYFICSYIQVRGNKDNQLMNPEKSGSVWDLQFNSNQVRSADEAEKLIFYKASFKAFRAVNIASIVLWIVTLIMAMVGNSGIFPMFCVCVIELVNIAAFSRESARLQM